MNKNKKSLILFLSCFFCYNGQVSATLIQCDIAAPIGVLINAENGKILFSKNAESSCYPASTTKLATALYVLHKTKGGLWDDKIIASSDALGTVSSVMRRSTGKHPSYRLEFGGTHMGIKTGEELDFKTLLYGLMLPSGNDAANVLAETVSDSISDFVDELNVFLKELGCKNTNFKNPHGLPDESHTTTAYDLALMAREALKYPLFREVVSSTRFERKETNKQAASWLLQNNHLVKPGKYFYPYATGVKTGYTVKSGFTIVASAEKGDRKLIAVVAGCDELAKRYRSVIQLFEAAFNEPKQTRKLLSQEHDVFHKTIEGAKENLVAVLPEDVIVSFYPSEKQEFFPRILWLNCSLPLSKGDEVGVIQLVDGDGSLIKTIPLLAAKPIHPTVMYQIEKSKQKLVLYLKAKKVYLGYCFGFMLLLASFGVLYKKYRRKIKVEAR